MEDFDKRFEHAQKNAAMAGIIFFILGLGGMGFAIWVILKLMAHYGII